MKEPSNKNAVLYLRCSSERQAQKDLSIPSQHQVCQKYATDNGFSVVNVFEDAGKSARSVERDGFLEMIEFCKTYPKKIDALIVYDTSRFARDRYDAAVYKRMLKNKGVRVLYASQNINPDEDGGFLMEGIFELFDEHYSRALAKVTLRGMIENARRGYQNGAFAPYGFQRVKIQDEKGNSKVKLELVESHAATIRAMYEFADKGYGLTNTARKLRELGIKDRRGKYFARSTIAKILQDETNIGFTVFNRRDSQTGRQKPREEWIIVENTHAPIIEKELFKRVQKSIEDRSPDVSHGRALASPRIFSQMIYCQECGGRLTADTAQGRKKKQYAYYTCRNRRFGEKGSCKGLRLPSGELDSFLLQNILERIFSEKNMKSCMEEWNHIHQSEKSKNTGHKIQLQKAIQKLERQGQNIVKAIAEGIIHSMDARQEMDRIRTEKAQLEVELTGIDKPIVPHFRITDELVKNVRQSFIGMINIEKPLETKSFIRKFVERIDVSKEEVKIEYLLPSMKAPSPEDGGGSGSYLRLSKLGN